MKNAILIPGRPDKEEYYDPALPSNSNDHWFPWLTKQLILNDIFTVSLEIPTPWQPRYEIWKKELERFDIDSETILVGHSCGGGFLVRYLSENKDLKVGKVVLVAPWINPDSNPESDTADFFDFDVDEDLAGRTEELTIMCSQDDQESVVESVRILKTRLNNVNILEFSDKGHFTFEDMSSRELPELLREILR